VIVTQFGVPVERIIGYDKETGDVMVWLRGGDEWYRRNIMNLRADGGLTEIMSTIEGEVEFNYKREME
jgi:hypothetical protein